VKTALSWHNVTHRKARTLATLAGVGFAIVLIYMQLGVYVVCWKTSTIVHELLDFDIALTSSRYIFLLNPEPLPRERLHQAAAVAGVESVEPVQIGVADWRNTVSRLDMQVLVLGVDPSDRPFILPDLNDSLPLLTRINTAIMDELAMPGIGPHHPGTVTEVAGCRLEVVGAYRWGAGFHGPGTLIVSEHTFARMFGTALPTADLALVRLSTEADAAAVARDIGRRLPEDARVWTRSALEEVDRAFFMTDRPTGLIFTSGVVLGFVVGTVILLQVLSSEVSNHLSEFATLKALGYSPAQVYAVVIEQGFTYALASFIPASVLAWGLFAVIEAKTMISSPMHLDLMAAVLALSLVMCSVAGLLATRRLDAADPADLF
jgi:putative ABC transport system permease protein